MFLKKLPIVLFLLTFLVGGNAFGLSERKTAAIKVAYLYYFSKFVTWPDNTVFDEGKLNLCTGSNTQEVEFQLSTIDGKKVGDNLLRIVYVNESIDLAEPDEVESEKLATCHILYVSAGLVTKYKLLQKKIPAYTLIVSESESVSNNVILLHTLNNKLSFEIDQALAEEKSLKISSKLLRLSKRRN